jgi:hypothetical protein
MRVDNSSIAMVAGVFILDRLSRRFRWVRWVRLLLPIAAILFTWWSSRRVRSM